jgi:hypothetical protein
LEDSSQMETMLPRCRQMRQSSSLASLSYRESHEGPAKNSHRLQSPRLQTSPPERTKTSTTATTSVPFAQRTSRDTRAASGLVALAGLSSILAASRSGPLTRARLLPVNRPRTANFLPHDSGAAQDATFPRTFCLRTSTVGVRRSWIQSHCPDSHHSLAVRRALAHESCQRSVLTHVP